MQQCSDTRSLLLGCCQQRLSFTGMGTSLHGSTFCQPAQKLHHTCIKTPPNLGPKKRSQPTPEPRPTGIPNGASGAFLSAAGAGNLLLPTPLSSCQ